MPPKWLYRRPGAALAPAALLVFWLLLLPLVHVASGWAPTEDTTPAEAARHAFLAGDYGRALADYRKLATGGSAEAAYWLAHMQELGLGGEPNPAEAVGWYRKAADGGMVAAERRLGEIYRDGVMTSQDAVSARDFLKRAAMAGDAVAEREFGLLWRSGIGGKQDPIEAYVWLALAARHGDHPAIKLRDGVLSQMTAADQSEAEALAASRAATAASAPADQHLG
jgi:TPR repeat protein